ncbi:helix-turn-helix transcriptional regulator [Pseudomonas fluorescens]|uniref:helix-turn-helix transcriptional regulator n=1 Tax=Pseudomonas fluorescens TaxID=294 RepID=UPI003F944D3B
MCTNLALDQERRLTFSVLKTAIAALSSVIGRNTELLLHDLESPEHSVVAIANGHISGRQVGSPILGGPEQDRGFALVMDAASSASTGPVFTDTYTSVINGRELRSVTAVFRDSSGTPFASLCINADLTDLNLAQRFLENLQPAPSGRNESQSEPADIELLMAQIIQTSSNSLGLGKMNKRDKVEAVRAMQERGLFIVKGGVEKAAVALGVTRFTIYNYLEEIRNLQQSLKNE